VHKQLLIILLVDFWKKKSTYCTIDLIMKLSENIVAYTDYDPPRPQNNLPSKGLYVCTNTDCLC